MDNQLIFWYRVVTAHADVIVLTNLPVPPHDFRVVWCVWVLGSR